MYALYGEIEFEVIAHWNRLSVQYGANFAEHALIDGKPRLQWVGDSLDQLQMTLVFSHLFCDPAIELEKLKTALTKHEPAALVFGSGEYKGLFVITDLQPEIKQTDAIGNALQIECNVTFKEFVGNKVEKRAGKAVDDGRTPVPTKIRISTPVLPKTIANRSTLQQTLDFTASAIKQGAGYLALANQAMKAAGGLKSETAFSQIRALMRSMNGVIPSFQSANKGMQSLDGLVNNARDIQNAVNSVLSLSNNAQNGLRLATISTAANQIQYAVSQVDQATSALSTVNSSVARMAARAITKSG